MRYLIRLFFLSTILASLARGQGSAPVLWYWQNAYPNSLDDVSKIKAQINLAASYGYTGVAFWSSTFAFMGSTFHPANNVAYMLDLMSYARSKGMKTMAGITGYGYSDDALLNNPNLAEGMRITGSRFTVNASKTALVPVNSFAGLANPGFESGQTGWFSWGDSNMGIDSTVAHSGAASGYVTKAAGNARFAQTLHLTPWRQYHGRVFIKTANFSGFTMAQVWDQASGLTLFNTTIQQPGTKDWTELDFTFNSRNMTQPQLMFGVWGGSSGTIWFDDALIEETSLVYVLRRSGTPLEVYNPADAKTVYTEGKDFNPVADPQLAASRTFAGYYHAPVTVTLPATTSLKPGQTVAMNYYTVQPATAAGDVGICLTEPAAQTWLQQNAKALVSNLPAETSYMLSYDEMRHMDSCAACKAKNMTPGQLLAWHVTNTYNLYHGLAPSASFYIWGDMFDPYQNAVNNYYYVDGNIAGSWAGVPSAVTIMNWNLANLTKSLKWFSGLDSKQPIHYKQIVAGYYDTGDGAAAATRELQDAAGIPGITGLMYTTWANNYSQLQAFAAAAKSNWANYLRSVTGK
jgi:hypothetical protein